MGPKLGEPHVVKQEARCIVGCYAVYEGENENWAGAKEAFNQREHEIKNRKGDTVWWFLYRPHRDHPEIPASVKACFQGAEVADFREVPAGLSTTRFAEGDYVTVECEGDTEDEAQSGVVPAIGVVDKWFKDHGYGRGDEGGGIIICNRETMKTPPFRYYFSARIVAERCVLDGVPRVGFYPEQQKHKDSKMRCPEDVCFPACLRACLEYLGDDLGCKQTGAPESGECGYAYLMGTTGAAFRLSWKPGWHGDNVATWLVSDDPGEIFRRGLASVGYEFSIVHAESKEAFRSRIISSIRDEHRPVIAHGVVGPPEECIITGYDEGGDVLIGWSFFQSSPEFNAGVEYEPSGYFRKRGWLNDTLSLILIGKKQQPPDRKQVFRDALTFALDVVRTPLRYGDRHNGLAAYDAWAAHLLRDEDFATDDLSVLSQRFMVHDDAVGTVAEGRWYASIFLTQAAAELPAMADDLKAAAACYVAEHDLMWKVWGLSGFERSEANARKLANPEVRRQTVPIIREARAKDAEAADHLEAALEKR